jgi:hypothetical protein
MIARVGIVISSCKHYFSNVPELIKQLEICKFPKENILIVSGQEDENITYYDNDVKIVKVTYTGLHLTGLIYIYENKESYSNINLWIALPDTIKFGENFYDKITDFLDKNNDDFYTIPLVDFNKRPTMDMGIVHIKHIINIQDYLKKIKKEIPYDFNDIIQLKQQLVFNEDIILGLTANTDIYATKFEYINPSFPKPTLFLSDTEEKTVEINNKLCREIYFTHIDLYKFQRNWRGPYVPLVMEL